MRRSRPERGTPSTTASGSRRSPATDPGVRRDAHEVYYVYHILAPRRDALAAYLKEKEIGTAIYYPKPLHLQPCFAYLGYKEGDFPVAERVSTEILALPMYPELTDDEIDYVCDAIQKFYL